MALRPERARSAYKGPRIRSLSLSPCLCLCLCVSLSVCVNMKSAEQFTASTIKYSGSAFLSLIDWLMITFIALFSALLSRLTALACGSTWVCAWRSLTWSVFWLLRFYAVKRREGKKHGSTLSVRNWRWTFPVKQLIGFGSLNSEREREMRRTKISLLLLLLLLLLFLWCSKKHISSRHLWFGCVGYQSCNLKGTKTCLAWNRPAQKQTSRRQSIMHARARSLAQYTKWHINKKTEGSGWEKEKAANRLHRQHHCITDNVAFEM